MNQISDECVDVPDGICPAFRNRTQGNALTDTSLLADYASNALELTAHSFVDGNDFIESVGDLASKPGPVRRQAD